VRLISGNRRIVFQSQPRERNYKSDEEFLDALAEALREEYKAIVDAGLILQLDDPGLPDTWDMANPEPSVDEYKKFAMVRVEATLLHGSAGLSVLG